jgi:phosphoenolpyruvate phosphomutase
MARACAYQEAGADIIVVHSKADTGGEVLRFADVWQRRVPLVIIPTTYPTISVAEAGQRGISAVIWANQLIRASIHATERLLAEMLEADRLSDCRTPIAPLQQLLGIVNGFSEPAPLALLEQG